MNNFEFISHESFPDDLYTKEVVTLHFRIEKKDSSFFEFDVTYARRKKQQDNSLYWCEASHAVTVRGQDKKRYIDGFAQDSKSLDREIKSFLDSRAWEKKQTIAAAPQSMHYPHGLCQPQQAPARSGRLFRGGGKFKTQEQIPF